MNEILSVVNVTKTFRYTEKQRRLFRPGGGGAKRKTALDNLSFSVNRGEIFGLMGPNGAGKTTAMRIISTQIKSDSGDVFVDGINVGEFPLRVRRRIGFLSLDLKLEEFFTPSYLFDFFSALREVPRKQARERREKLFGRFGVDEYANEKLSVLSSGMKQKVSLVVSIVHDPQVIIFDEPTNGLDLLAVRAVSDFLLELKSQGKTIILATHIFNLAEKICDRVGFIVNGRILNSDTLCGMSETSNLEEAFFSFYDRSQGEPGQ
ncbi:MAG: ABC transporter ATP-binding protein [Treponema sp.]|nr:ABC transporter ATP-binding protein [Treponema sp.]